jgi:hypothetical protein
MAKRAVSIVEGEEAPQAESTRQSREFYLVPEVTHAFPSKAALLKFMAENPEEAQSLKVIRGNVIEKKTKVII